MAITVGDIYSQFPNFKQSDMIRLVGSEDFNGRTVVKLSNIASFGNRDLSIFVAKREGKNYTNMLGEKNRTEVNEVAGIKDETPKNEKSESKQDKIPMDLSIFNMKDEKSA